MRTKFLLVVILCAAVIMTGCLSESNAGEIKIGMIKYLNASEENMNELMKKIEQKNGQSLSSYSTVYYDNLSSMQLALSSGQIEQMSTYRCVANYTTGKNSDFVMVPTAAKLSDSFCCAFRQEDSHLKNEFDTAIKSMQEDGTLLNLTKMYISDLAIGEEPQVVEIKKIDGAETIKVAVTGDLPPLDLIKSNGSPAGFNTAVLAEISKRSGKNIELVSIDSGARASALITGTVDVLFWARVPDKNSDMPSDLDIPSGIIFALPYFSDRIVHLGRAVEK